jgi:hypothetical protein
VSRVLLDTSVVIGAADRGDLEGAITAASPAELCFGTLVASQPDERARRAQRLGVIEATFDPLPVDAPAAQRDPAARVLAHDVIATAPADVGARRSRMSTRTPKAISQMLHRT